MAERRTALEQAKRNGFLSWRWSFGIPMSNEYFKWCRIHNRPFVKITKGREKLVQVEMDMLTTRNAHAHGASPSTRDEQFFDIIENLFEEFAVKHLKAKHKEIYGAGWQIGNWSSCHCIREVDGEKVASRLLQIGERWALESDSQST